MKVIAELKAAGVAVIFISHRLNEVEHCADRVVVLRDGAVVGELARGAIGHDAMIRMMIGRDLKSLYIPPQRAPAGAVLEIAGLRTPAHAGHAIDLSLHAGEILGMAGLVGAGRTELACAIFGVDRPVGGEVRLDGRTVAIRTPRDAIDHGIFLVPEDRKRSGLVLELSVNENISLANLAAFAWDLLIRTGAERRNATERSAALDIRTASIDTMVGTLSGGNQQKVVLAKWLSMTPESRDLRRADARHRCRLEVGDLQPDARARRFRRRRPHDLERHGGGDRRQRPHRGHARGADRRLPRTPRVQRGERDAAGRRPARPAGSGGRDVLKKDLGLFLLIVVVGLVVSILNPRFLSPINLGNTANLIGLFGLFSIGEGFVIITGGIDLAIGSMFALLGVIFIDLLVTWQLEWWLAVLVVILGGVVLGAIHGFLVTRLRLQPFIVTLCGLLIYRGVARYYTNDGTAGFEFGQSFPTLEWLTTGRTLGVPHSFIMFLVVAAVMAVVLHRSVFGRYLFAVGKNEEAARYSGIRTGRIVAAAYIISGGLAGPLLDLPRDVHALDLAGVARQFLRALRHRRRRAGRLLAARRRGLDPGHRAGRHPAADPAEPGEPARHPELAQLRRDGHGDPDRRRGRPAAHAPQGPPRQTLDRRGAPLQWRVFMLFRSADLRVAHGHRACMRLIVDPEARRAPKSRRATGVARPQQ